MNKSVIISIAFLCFHSSMLAMEIEVNEQAPGTERIKLSPEAEKACATMLKKKAKERRKADIKRGIPRACLYHGPKKSFSAPTSPTARSVAKTPEEKAEHFVAHLKCAAHREADRSKRRGEPVEYDAIYNRMVCDAIGKALKLIAAASETPV